MEGPIQVVYIVGSGRSGSTVLDTILGSHDQVESVGELINAPRAWQNPDEYCACGELAGSCEFWKAVQEEWHSRLPRNIQPDSWPSVQAAYERYRYFPRTLRAVGEPTGEFEAYAQGMFALYKAIQVVSGKPTILDSSKNPLRALALSAVPGVQLKLIHLIRDGRGVVWSLRKPYMKDPKRGVQRDLKERSVFRTTLFWWITNKLSEAACRRMPLGSAIQVRYEDFVSVPQDVFGSVGNLSRLDFKQVIDELVSGVDFKVGHTIAGNRLRMSGKVRLRADLAWKHQLTTLDKVLFWTMAGRMASRYGYHWRT